jgi:hypothetical protein
VPEDVKDDDNSLDAVLSKTLENYSEDAPVEAAPAVDDEPPAARDDGRDEQGRFKSKQAAEGGVDAPAAEVPAVEGQPPVDATPAAEAPKAPAWTDGHFTGWKPEQREKFAALPPDVQALVMERQAEQQAFFQRKLGEEGEFRKQAEPLYQAAQEVEQFARSIGSTPADLMKSYAAIDYNLRYAPYAEKVQLFAKIAGEYGIPFAQPETDPYADPLQPNGQAYPVVHDLQSQVRQLQTQLQTYQQQAQASTQQQLQSTVESFSKATKADGTPAHPWFDTVKGAMGQLMASGQAQTLEDAYAKAVKPIEDRLAAEVAQRQKAAAEKQAQELARARKAAPVRTTASASNGRSSGGGLDAVLNSALTQHGL